MKLINSKSIIDCDEQEEKIHADEINNVLELLHSKGNYDCAVLKKYQDEGHKHIEMEILHSNLYNISDVIEDCDLKNGVDVCIDEEGYYVFIVYGQIYELGEKYHMVTTALKIMPYDENREFISFI